MLMPSPSMSASSITRQFSEKRTSGCGRRNLKEDGDHKR